MHVCVFLSQQVESRSLVAVWLYFGPLWGSILVQLRSVTMSAARHPKRARIWRHHHAKSCARIVVLPTVLQ